MLRPGRSWWRRRDECERVKRCGARVLTLDQLEGLKVGCTQVGHTVCHANGSACPLG